MNGRRAPVSAVAGADAHLAIELNAPIDLAATLWPVVHGGGDPTIRIARDGAWRATRTPLGPATIRLIPAGTTISVTAWGEGAGWAADHARELVGANDRPEELVPQHGVIAQLVHRLPVPHDRRSPYDTRPAAPPTSFYDRQK